MRGDVWCASTRVPRISRRGCSNLTANMFQIQQSELLTPSDSLIGVLPMWHIYALQLLLAVSP